MFFNTTAHYTLTTGGFVITLNALGKDAEGRNYTQCYTLSDARLYVYIEDEDNQLAIFTATKVGDDVRKSAVSFPIACYPTHFANSERRYVYAAIPRTMTADAEAVIVYPDRQLDVLGRFAQVSPLDGATVAYQMGNPNYYYINLGGIISPATDGPREWEQGIEQGAIFNYIIGDDAANMSLFGSAIYLNDKLIAQLDSLNFFEQVTDRVPVYMLDEDGNVVLDPETGDPVIEQVQEVDEEGNPIFIDDLGNKTTEDTGLPSMVDKVEEYDSVQLKDKYGYVRARNVDADKYSFRNGDKYILDIQRSTDPPSTFLADEIIPTVGYLNNIYGRRFLSRLEDDSAEGHITFLKGVSFGNFVTGMVGGQGGRIDAAGNGELESLVLRSFLEVPELRFNRIDVVSGELWNSIAFGTIDHVEIDSDGNGGVAYLHLDANEYGTLEIGDICRGIFANFGDGAANDYSIDDNGFANVKGFETAYFTPTNIITNKKGEFAFHYALQSGTNVHPCEAMKFAVYGSFYDENRRASAYHTRTYTRYLKDVQTWQLIPDKNIASQFGNLDGLEIGGMKMSGEGTYLSNIFMTGALIQFTPEQQEQLKGEDAYSVTLTDYEAILHIDIDGHVIGINVERNVVANDGDVKAMLDGETVNVIDLAYAATATIQAYKGATIMAHSSSVAPGELTYIVNPVFRNCEGFVLNGVLVVTRVIDTNMDASVDLYVNCEGNAVFEKHFAITVLKESMSNIIADFDNDMETVVQHSVTGNIVGSPFVATGRMYYGDEYMDIESMTVVGQLPTGITCTTEKNIEVLDGETEEDKDGNLVSRCLSVTAKLYVDKTAPASSVIEFLFVGRKIGNTTPFEKRAHITVNKVSSLFQFKLNPAVSEVKVDSDGTFNGSSTRNVKCDVLINDGSNAPYIASSYAALKEKNVRMFYKKNTTSETPTFSTDEITSTGYSDGISVSGSDDSVTFWIYYYPNGINSNTGRVKFDMETIHVLKDASQYIESYMFTRFNPTSTQSAPSVSSLGGSYTNPTPSSSVWKDGIPSGEAQVWMTHRTFCSDSSKSDPSWSDPKPMTDTADFDVCYHDAIDASETLKNPTTHHSEDQGNGWYNSTSGKNPMYMATDRCSNGVWEGWRVVKILGESPVVADLDNEGDGLGVGANGKLDIKMETATNFHMWYGHEELYVESVTISGIPTYSKATPTYSSTNKYAHIKFEWGANTDFNDANSHYQITITGTAKYKGVSYTRTAYYSIHGSKDAEDGVVLMLEPSANAIKKDKSGAYHPSSLSCKRYKKVGESNPTETSVGTLQYKTSTMSSFSTYSTALTNFANVTDIIFKWTVGSAEIIDSVPIIEDGIDGKSYVGTGEFYYATATKTETLPSHTVASHSSWKSTTADLTNKFSKDYPYLWNFEIVEIILSDGSTSKTATTPEMISYWGQNGKGISSVDERYLANASSTTPSTDPSTCSTNSKDAGFSAAKPYLWNNQRVKFEDNTYGSWTGWQQISYWGQDGQPGPPGPAGKNAPRTIYISQSTKPNTPSGVNPSGWSESPTVSYENVTLKNVSYDTSVDTSNPWYTSSDGYYASKNGLAHSSSSTMKITFEVEKNCDLAIDYVISSEKNYDYGYIGYIGNTQDRLYTSYEARYSDASSGTLSLEVKSSGTHFLFVGYKKDGSNSVGDDCFKVKLNSARTPLPLWSSVEELNSDGSHKGWSAPIRYDGQKGAVGYTGAQPRFFKYSELKDDSALFAGLDGEKYTDIVIDDKGMYWHPLQSGTKSSLGTPSTSNTKWEASKQSFVATDLLFAEMAYIKNLGVNNLLATTSSNQLKGGFCAVDSGLEGKKLDLGDVRLWLGSDTPQTAPYRVTENGEIYAEKGVFKGALYSEFVNSTDASKYDKLAPLDDFTIELPYGKENIGRRLSVLSNYSFTRTWNPVIIKYPYNIYGKPLKSSPGYEFPSRIEFAGGIVELIAIPRYSDNTIIGCEWMMVGGFDLIQFIYLCNYTGGDRVLFSYGELQ